MLGRAVVVGRRTLENGVVAAQRHHRVVVCRTEHLAIPSLLIIDQTSEGIGKRLRQGWTGLPLRIGHFSFDTRNIGPAAAVPDFGLGWLTGRCLGLDWIPPLHLLHYWYHPQQQSWLIQVQGILQWRNSVQLPPQPTMMPLPLSRLPRRLRHLQPIQSLR